MIKPANNKDTLDPMILWANHALFKPGQQRVSFPCVQSRMVVYCMAGNGTVRVNGSDHEMVPGRFLFLPWNHAISYCADRKSSMQLVGVHIIPLFRPKKRSIAYEVPHRRTDRFFDDPERQDGRLPGLEGVLEGNVVESSVLALLLRFVVEWFRRVPRDEPAGRDIARLLLDELRLAFGAGQTKEPVPIHLQSVLDHVQENLDKKLSIGALAEIAECSPSTLSRMIRRHSGMSPIQWMARMRMDHAGLLLSTTGTRIGAVGQQSGFEDPYYFSKIFKKHHGMTAREYRKKNSAF